MRPHLPTALRLPAALFAGALLLGSSAFYLALEARSNSQAEQHAARQQAEEARRDLQHAPNRLAQDRVQAATYAELDQSGFIGDEDRLDWISRLAHLRSDLRMERLSWRLGVREHSSLSYGLRHSRMDLDLATVDTARLDRFLRQLRQQAHGRYTINSCILLPGNGGVIAGEGVVNCTLDWWTWDDR